MASQRSGSRATFAGTLGAMVLGLSLFVGSSANAQPVGTSFDECGVIVDGVECVLFSADSGLLLVVNLAGFSVGDNVRVVGTYEPFCITICQQGDGCIFDEDVTPCGGLDPEFVRGDLNDDGNVDIADPVALLAALFVAGTPPIPCQDSQDGNDDGGIDISDAIFLLANLFAGGPSPSAPFPDCGTDPSADTLTCDAFVSCP